MTRRGDHSESLQKMGSFVPMLLGCLAAFLVFGGGYIRYTGWKSFQSKVGGHVTKPKKKKTKKKRGLLAKIQPDDEIGVGTVIAGRKQHHQDSIKHLRIHPEADGESVTAAFDALGAGGSPSALPRPTGGASHNAALPPLRSLTADANAAAAAAAAASSGGGKGAAQAGGGAMRAPLPGIDPGKAAAAGPDVSASRKASIINADTFVLTIERATNLAHADVGSGGAHSADPYAIVHWGQGGRDQEEVHRTRTIHATQEPVWAEERALIVWPHGLLARKQQQLRIEVWDCDHQERDSINIKKEKKQKQKHWKASHAKVHDDFLGEIRLVSAVVAGMLKEGGAAGQRKTAKLLPQYGLRLTDKESKYVQGELTISVRPATDADVQELRPQKDGDD